MWLLVLLCQWREKDSDCFRQASQSFVIAPSTSRWSVGTFFRSSASVVIVGLELSAYVLFPSSLLSVRGKRKSFHPRYDNLERFIVEVVQLERSGVWNAGMVPCKQVLSLSVTRNHSSFSCTNDESNKKDRPEKCSMQLSLCLLFPLHQEPSTLFLPLSFDSFSLFFPFR